MARLQVLKFAGAFKALQIPDGPPVAAKTITDTGSMYGADGSPVVCDLTPLDGDVTVTWPGDIVEVITGPVTRALRGETVRVGDDSASSTAPAQVTGLTLIAIPSGLMASWSTPDDGGAAISDYKVEYNISGSWIVFAHDVSTDPHITVTGLIAETPTGVRVSARNAVGYGPVSDVSTEAPTVAPAAIRELPLLMRTTAFWPVIPTYDAGTSPKWGSTYNRTDWTFSSPTTYYISPTGNDANDGLSSGSPKRTIANVISSSTGNIKILAAPGRYPQVGIITSRNVQVEASIWGTVYVGPFLTSADIASISTLASGHQTVTLTSGYAAGFVDLTHTYSGILDRHGGERNPPCVAVKKVATVADVANFQGADNASTGAFKPGAYLIGSGATHTVYGMKDARQLTAADFDDDILAWKASPATDGTDSPFKLAGTTQLTSLGVYWVGGNGSEAPVSTSRIVIEGGGCLGGDGIADNSSGPNQPLSTSSLTILKDSTFIGNGAGDVIDYAPTPGQSKGIHDNIIAGQTGIGGCQGSTTHGGKPGALNINCVFFSVEQAVGNLGSYMEAILGCKLYGFPWGSSGSSGLFNAINSAGEFHVADALIVGTVPAVIGSVALESLIVLYDTSLDPTKISGAGQVLQWAGTTAPPSSNIFSNVTFTAANCRQNVNGTGIVSAHGDPVAYVADGVSGLYSILIAGSAIYDTSGPVPCVTGTDSRWELQGQVQPFGICDVFIAAKSASATQWRPMASKSASGGGAFAEMFTSAGAPSSSTIYNAATAPVHKVNDGAARTTKTLLRDAMLNGSRNVLSVQNIDLSWCSFRQFRIDGASPYNLNGSIYGWMIAAHDDALYPARYANMAARAGN